MRTFTCLMSAVLLCGCAVHPTARYVAIDNVIPKNADGAVDDKIAAAPNLNYGTDAQTAKTIKANYIAAYFLPRNTLTISYKGTEQAGKTTPPDLRVDNARQEFEDTRYILMRGDDLWHRSIINLSKEDDIEVPASIGVEVIDNRKDIIDNSSQILTTLIGAGVGTAENGKTYICDKFPDSVCVWGLPDDTTRASGSQSSAATGGAQLTVTWHPLPVTAVRADSVFTLGTITGPMPGIYVAACRTVDVTYALGGADAAKKKWSGKVADPRWLEFVAFPNKGSIKANTQCGYSATAEKDTVASPDALAAEAVKQAVAIKAALDKAQ